ncbi:MAG: AMP-binding protein, partial [Deltaproteobacteria bacterium]|nr:AMP-binding protein [Deltaproteobacteria bacterium]
MAEHGENYASGAERRLNFTMGGLLADIARRFPANDALVYPARNLRYTYQEFNALCDRVAKGLMAIGVQRDDKVAIWATNVPEWVILDFASSKIGAALVTINTLYKSAELESILKQSDTSTLCLIKGFSDIDYVETLCQIAPEIGKYPFGETRSAVLPFLRRVLFIGEGAPEGMMNFGELEKLGESVPDAEYRARTASLDQHDVITLQYTSGTTGLPKGVMLTHHNIINNGYFIGECMNFTEKDRLCVPVPFFHCFGSVLAILAAVTHGAALVIPWEYFRPEPVLQAIEREKCTAVHGVPTMFIAEMEHPRFSRYDVSSLRTGIMAGTVCPIDIMRRAVNLMNLREITSVYGLTEASPGITQTRVSDSIELRVSTVGRVLPGAEAKVIDVKTGQTLPPGQQGEIVARGYMVMKGYYKQPEETAKVIEPDGWLHTGDLGEVDENGYFRITGRVKQMIIRGGENVYPLEIENYLYTHPKIAYVQVFG